MNDKAIEQELKAILRTGEAQQRAAEQRLRQWAKDNPGDPLAADINDTLSELWAARMDYGMVCDAVPNLDELVRNYQASLRSDKPT